VYGPRTITARYDDPLDVVWLETARRLGFTVVRRGDVYASYDGKGTLALSEPGALDPDDNVAQMVFHELCHALVQGPESVHQVDWGLSVEGLDALEEHATHRVQAALADRHGLRGFFGVTTDWRPYYDALPADPLSGDDEAVPLAREAFLRATEGPWAAALDEALAATAAIVRATKPFAGRDSLFR
jgi:hypothetical protein